MLLIFSIQYFRQVERLFYDSKLRVNGRKITKKSMDVMYFNDELIETFVELIPICILIYFFSVYFF